MENLSKHVICFGEVLWDLLPGGARIGGAPLNVCYHLHQQGISSQIVSQVGMDELGGAILSQLQSWHIDGTYCKAVAGHPTSVVEVALDSEGKANYTIVEDVAWDYIAYDEEVAEAIADAAAFIFGTLACRHEVSFHTLKRYLTHAKYAIMDINLRSPYYSAELVLDLLQYADCLKINDEEIVLLGEWLGFQGKAEEELLGHILQSVERLQGIILTKGAKGSLYYSAKGCLSSGSYVVKVADTVGAGDAFLAAFLAKVLQEFPIQDALEHASLVAGYVATQAGACPSYTNDQLVTFKSLHHK